MITGVETEQKTTRIDYGLFTVDIPVNKGKQKNMPLATFARITLQHLNMMLQGTLLRQRHMHK